MFFDPTCIYCNSRASREANEAIQRNTEATQKNTAKTLRATQQMQSAQQQQLRAQDKALAAEKAEKRRQESIAWSQQNRQQKQAKAATTSAARKAQGGGLLPKEKLWIYGGLLLAWAAGIFASYKDERWVGFACLLALGAAVGYFVYKRATKAKGTPPPSSDT